MLTKNLDFESMGHVLNTFLRGVVFPCKNDKSTSQAVDTVYTFHRKSGTRSGRRSVEQGRMDVGTRESVRSSLHSACA